MQRTAHIYAMTAALMLAMALLCVYFGDSGLAIFLKTLLVPVFLLASRGLRTFFPQENDAFRPWFRQIEFHLLDGALLAFFTIAVTVNPRGAWQPAVIDFIVMTILIAAANSVMHYRRRRRH